MKEILLYKFNDDDYFCKVMPYGNHVIAQILVKSKKDDTRFEVVNTNTFGGWFGSAPKEKHYIKAKEWLNKQILLINKHKI